MTDNKTDTISTAQALRDSIQMTDALIATALDKQQSEMVTALLAQRRGLAQGLLELSCGEALGMRNWQKKP